MGTLEAVAAAKAELIRDMPAGGTAIVPADEPLLEPHLRDDLDVVTFGDAGDVRLAEADGERVAIDARGERIELELTYTQAYNRLNTLAAVAAALAVGVRPAGRVEVPFSALRGERIDLPNGVAVVNDCYNANPMSMRAALDELAVTASGRRVAVLGDMLELGEGERYFHEEIGAIRAGARRGPARHRRSPGRGHARRLRRRGPGRGRRRRGRIDGARAARAGGHGAGEGLARCRAGGGRRSAGRGCRLMGKILIAGTASLLICIFLSPKFISFLHEREFGQNIRPEGPRGPPREGGHADDGRDHHHRRDRGAVPHPVLAHGAGARGVRGGDRLRPLGFADDYTKIVKRRSLGLRARTKLIVTIAISLGLWWVATEEAGLSNELRLRIVDYQIDLGIFYPVLIYLVVAGTTSAVNLTDGLDGLAAGCAAIVLLAFIGITFITTGQRDLALLSACLVGGCIGFLWFNSFPAQIFMGDTGSLALGGAIAGLAVMTKTEILLIILGGIFVIEALSVAIQVFAFQAFRKRVFLMAPVHHHFELMAWSETKIILRFWIVAAACSAIGFTIYQNSIS